MTMIFSTERIEKNAKERLLLTNTGKLSKVWKDKKEINPNSARSLEGSRDFERKKS
jgi:hypothetical protein